MKTKIERAVLKRMKIKDIVTGQPFVLSEDSDMVLMKLSVRSGHKEKEIKDQIPENMCLILSIDCGVIELMKDSTEVLPVEAELTGRIMTL